MPSPSFLAAILCHVALGAAAIVALALTPPDRGAMLLVPLSGTVSDTINAALSARAALVGRGPLPGSIVVFGDRSRIERRADGFTMIVLAAPAGICGSSSNRELRS